MLYACPNNTLVFIWKTWDLKWMSVLPQGIDKVILRTTSVASGFTFWALSTWVLSSLFERTHYWYLCYSSSWNPLSYLYVSVHLALFYILLCHAMTFCCCFLYTEFELSLRIYKILHLFAWIFLNLCFNFGFFSFSCVCVCVTLCMCFLCVPLVYVLCVSAFVSPCPNRTNGLNFWNTI